MKFLSSFLDYCAGLAAGYGIWGDHGHVWWWIAAAVVLSIAADFVRDLA